MNIVVDIRPLMEGKISGIETYTINVLRELFKLDTKNSYILFANGAKDVSNKLPQLSGDNVSIIQTKIPNKILNLSISLLRYPKLDRLIIKYLKKHPGKAPKNMKEPTIDLFFMPDLRPTALTKKVKKITVVHDLSFRHFPGFFSKKTRLWYKILRPKREIEKSTEIIAVSSFTKHDLIETFKIPEEKITVIHEGIDENFCRNKTTISTEIRGKYHLPENYFLFLSTIEPRKNIQGMVRGFIIYKRLNRSDNSKLVIAGKKNQKIFSQVMHDDHPDIIFCGFIDEKDKAEVISGAKVFIYPSFFEGFGLPLLEAMKCETPIITSNTSSMPEIAGDAAILINPRFPEEMAYAMEKIQDPVRISELKKHMAEQVKKFTWKECASKTLNVFMKAFGKR